MKVPKTDGHVDPKAMRPIVPCLCVHSWDCNGCLTLCLFTLTKSVVFFANKLGSLPNCNSQLQLHSQLRNCTVEFITGLNRDKLADRLQTVGT